eukprot:762809-Hanusia_phi.AAC.3
MRCGGVGGDVGRKTAPPRNINLACCSSRIAFSLYFLALKTRDSLMLENELSSANMSANKALEQSLQHDTFKVFFNVPDKRLVDLAVRQIKIKDFDKLQELFNNPVVLHRLVDHLGIDSFCDEFLSSVLHLGKGHVPEEFRNLCVLLQEISTTNRSDLRVGQQEICKLIAERLPHDHLKAIEQRATEMIEEMRVECSVCGDKNAEDFSLVRLNDCISRLEMMERCEIESFDKNSNERLPLKNLLLKLRRMVGDVDSSQKMKEMKHMLVEPRRKVVEEFDRVSSNISRAQSIHAMKSKQVTGKHGYYNEEEEEEEEEDVGDGIMTMLVIRWLRLHHFCNLE